ncbi:AAA family ATPase [Mycolicibacterium komossense]|uniref:AAA family ATPase n=1 Tax=Mycolicibacterium komossense TaxID=1779 RepID=UPI00338EB92B
MAASGVLVILSGLPGVGKTTVARRVSGVVGGVHLRIDTIESAMVDSGIVAAAGGWDSAPDAGYRVAYGLAADLLRAGHIVIADSVNPLQITRRAWMDVATGARALPLNVEVVCRDVECHRGRVEARTSDLEGLIVPTWRQVQDREYEPWEAPVLRVDTASGTEKAADEIVAAIRARFTSDP